jgi:uncharacterized lipoprotein NlpE involved in copper resistance
MEEVMQTQECELYQCPTLVLRFDKTPDFCQLLQNGFHLPVKVDCTLKQLLYDQFGLSPDYVESRISTIFLDGKPVDDIASSIVKKGSTVALSAAMPGLLGATMRRGGHYAILRSGISHHSEQTSQRQLTDGVIVLKLFNVLARDLGPHFLSRGVWLSTADLKVFFDSRPATFWASLKAAILNGNDLQRDEIRTQLHSKPFTELKINLRICD